MSSSSHLITRFVNLSAFEYDIVHENARRQLCGKEAFSASLRQIVKEWYLMRKALESQPPEVRQMFALIKQSVELEVLPEDTALETSGRRLEYPASL